MNIAKSAWHFFLILPGLLMGWLPAAPSAETVVVTLKQEGLAGSRLKTGLERIALAEQPDIDQLGRGFVQAPVRRDQLRRQIAGDGKVEGVIVSQLGSVGEVDRVVQKPLRWSNQFQLEMQQVTEGLLDITGREPPLIPQGVADFLAEQVRRDQQEIDIWR